jgi:hydroxylysine kinase
MSDDVLIASRETDMVRKLLARYDLDGALTRLLAERDDLFVVRNAGGERLIVRMSAENELPSAIACQNAALESIAVVDPTLPVPRVLKSRNGKTIEWTEGPSAPRAARVFTYLDGAQVGKSHRSAAQRSALGHCLARLDVALSQAATGGMGRADVWDIERADQLLPLLIHQANGEVRELAERVIERFATQARGTVQLLPRQLIHNDFSTKNVLVAPDDSVRVTGIIDFGDLVHAPRVFDLAIALAKLVEPNEAVTQACEIAAAYTQRLPLGERELAVLYQITCLRLAMRIAVWGARQREAPSLETSATISATVLLLKEFERSGEKRTTELLLDCCSRSSS